MGAFGFVEEFLHYERASGKAKPTLRNRRAALAALSKWLDEQGQSEQDATSTDLVAFVNTLVGRYTPDHVNQVVSALRVYFRWVAEEGQQQGGCAITSPARSPTRRRENGRRIRTTGGRRRRVGVRPSQNSRKEDQRRSRTRARWREGGWQGTPRFRALGWRFLAVRAAVARQAGPREERGQAPRGPVREGIHPATASCHR